MASIGNCIMKVPNGKLLKVTVEFEENTIEKVQIKGDFFIHPEESIDELETTLKGVDYTLTNVSRLVSTFFGRTELSAFGITPMAVTEAIMKCKEEVA
jgi:hypothetical protein